MSEKKSNAPDCLLRRKTLKKLAVGMGALAGSTVLPEKWITPIIKGIVLPAHAQTSAPTVTFCTDRVQLTLVDGHSGTDEMTIEASGCITQANVVLNLTLLGFSTAVITRKDGGDEDSFYAAITEALVPSAHAADTPMCTVKEQVTTDATGNFKVTFKLNCGKGIVQVVLDGLLAGKTFNTIGWLDIHSCNPCAPKTKRSRQIGDCETHLVFTNADTRSSVIYEVDGKKVAAGDSIKIFDHQTLLCRLAGTETAYFKINQQRCDGTQGLYEDDNFTTTFTERGLKIDLHLIGRVTLLIADPSR